MVCLDQQFLEAQILHFWRKSVGAFKLSYTLYVSLSVALTGLHELSLDNTLVTDAGVMCLSFLTRLDVLSLSDTK